MSLRNYLRIKTAGIYKQAETKADEEKYPWKSRQSLVAGASNAGCDPKDIKGMLDTLGQPRYGRTGDVIDPLDPDNNYADTYNVSNKAHELGLMPYKRWQVDPSDEAWDSLDDWHNRFGTEFEGKQRARDLEEGFKDLSWYGSKGKPYKRQPWNKSTDVTRDLTGSAKRMRELQKAMRAYENEERARYMREMLPLIQEMDPTYIHIPEDPFNPKLYNYGL